jgi:hypothetical protein
MLPSSSFNDLDNLRTRLTDIVVTEFSKRSHSRIATYMYKEEDGWGQKKRVTIETKIR